MKIQHTFCVIFYQKSAFLRECLSSLTNQTVKSAVVICTSTPTNELLSVARDFGIEVKINPKTGKANDWNFAYNQAKTPYVTLAHHDDVYFPEYTERLLKKFAEHSDALIGFSDYAEEFTSDTNISRTKSNTLNLVVKRIILSIAFLHTSYIHSNFLKKITLCFGDTISCPTVMFNKSYLKSFKFHSKLQINLDWEAWWELANREGGFIWIRRQDVLHRIHHESHTSVALAGNARQVEDLEMFRRIWPKPISTIIAMIYLLSYAGNKVQ